MEGEEGEVPVLWRRESGGETECKVRERGRKGGKERDMAG